ncbi:hypothetical protein [Rhizobium ruizarguesonis]|uniref:hypothetical protein n=1 Tax=Rhizobium ruizarguesonis TaxID=2081791 RepID=UPI0010323603|nr:hypothetical protein [Rhizobium ruizarguesonis]TBE20542.1 hypothetical protein ELH05_28230 [Rhizobium ruizarguesonis]TCA27794.1 hypothetical protein E0H66_31840 [Rhizobium leguminosarum bv. viciae]WSH37101.1 hypothetical protein U8P70_28530 [Rhizobium ruizarguesonis]
MTNDIDSTIAGASGISGGAILMASQAIEGLTGKPPKLESQADLAGPNDNFQLLLDIATYAAISECVRPFLASLAGEAGKDAWQAIKSLWKKPPPEKSDAKTVEQIIQLQSAVRTAMGCGNTAIMGIRFESRRNAGIQLKSQDRAEFAAAAKLMAEYCEELMSRVEAERRRLMGEGAHSVHFVENGDCSIAIKVADNMIYVEMTVGWEGGKRQKQITVQVPFDKAE